MSNGRDHTGSARSIDPDAPPSVIESQLDAKRADLNHTLNQLEDRFNPEQMFDYVRENGGEIAGNLGRTFKQNPLPFLLTGVGLAWLMSAQSNTNREPYYPRYRSDRYNGNPYYEEDDLDDPDALHFGAHRSYATPATRHVDVGSYGDDDGQGGVGEAMDAAKQKAGEIGDSLSDTASSFSTTLADMTDEAKDRYETMRRDTSQRFARMSDESKRRYATLDDEARARYDRAQGSARRAAAVARRRARGTAEQGADFLKEQPLVAGAIGAAIGALIGSLLPPSRTEDRAFGQQADRMRGSAREEIEQHVDTAAGHAKEALSQASATAQDKLVEARGKAEELAKSADKKAQQKAGTQATG